MLRIGFLIAFVGLCASPIKSDDTKPKAFPEPEASAMEEFLRMAKRKTRNPYEDKDFEKRFEQLIEQLTDDEPKKREAAEKSLQEIGNPARAVLQHATKHANAEIAARARKLVDGLPQLTSVVTTVFDKPIPQAKVTLRLTGRNSDTPPVPQIVTLFADASGQIAIPKFPASHSMIVRVEHVDFGNGQLKIDRPTGLLRFPLVKRDSDLYKRAVKGVVVGHDGKPVARAVVQCGSVRTPGEGLINGVYPRGDAVTDSKGRFSYYLPNENRDRERGDLIPMNSRYALSISVPGDESFFPVTGSYNNREPVQIVLPHAARFHRFFFESSGGGVIEDPQQLRYCRIQYETKQDAERNLVPLDWEVVIKGRKLIPGTYRGSGHLNGKSIQFRPLVVKEDSPEELYFQLPPAVVYRGRVTHGVTGEPIPDAFLMGWSSTSRNNLALLTAEDWKVLRTVPSIPKADHPAMVKLRQHYGVQELVRTDKEGRFEITQRPEQEFYGFMAFAEDFVPFKKAMHYIAHNKTNIVDVAEFPLFPAAKVLVRPVVEGRHLSVSPRWLPTKEGQPEWIERFHAASDRSKAEFVYVHWLKINELQPIYVPADVRLRLKFETPYDDQWAPFTGNVLAPLAQGATHEIGDLHFTAALPAVVRVVDKNGRPVEGIPVRRMHNADRAWCIAHNTDKDGRAFFHVNPNSDGKFWVSDIRAPEEVSMAANLYADFKVGKDAPEAEFQIKITDEQIRLLLGPKSDWRAGAAVQRP